MADQVFDLTQTGQQVQDIINDASKVKDAGAQTTLTTESILLKDVNGNYHKILKSSFTEAIRDTLAGLLVNNDKGTTISRIAAIASGDFGSITPTNLASVLGVVSLSNPQNNTKTQFTSLSHGEDLNTVLTPGNYYTTTAAMTNNLKNKPTLTQSANARIIVIMNTNENHGWQFFLCRKQLFMRFFDAGVADTWQTIL